MINFRISSDIFACMNLIWIETCNEWFSLFIYLFYYHLKSNKISKKMALSIKVIPQFCIAHFYCAHLITYNFIHYTYRLKKISFYDNFMLLQNIFGYTFVQRITLKSMFSKKAYKSVARVPVSSISIHLYFTF